MLPIITPFLGAGITPAGITPAGAGAPANVQAGGGVIFPDPATGLGRTCRYIDPGTGQYDFNSLGNASGMGTVPQLVQIALSNADFSAIDVVGDPSDPTDPAKKKFAAVISAALAPFVNKNLLEVVSIDVSSLRVNGERGVVKWRDLTSGSEPLTSPF